MKLYNSITDTIPNYYTYSSIGIESDELNPMNLDYFKKDTIFMTIMLPFFKNIFNIIYNKFKGLVQYIYNQTPIFT